MLSRPCWDRRQEGMQHLPQRNKPVGVCIFPVETELPQHLLGRTPVISRVAHTRSLALPCRGGGGGDRGWLALMMYLPRHWAARLAAPVCPRYEMP